MKNIVMAALALLLVAPAVQAADVPALPPIPNLTALVAYDFAVKDLVAGASSKLLIYKALDLNVGYVTSEDNSAWTAGLGVDIKKLAEACKITYGWGAVRCGVSSYGGYDFKAKKAVYGISASLVQF